MANKMDIDILMNCGRSQKQYNRLERRMLCSNPEVHHLFVSNISLVRIVRITPLLHGHLDGISHFFHTRAYHKFLEFLPSIFFCYNPDVLRSYFGQKLEYLSKLMDTQCEDSEEEDEGKFKDQIPSLLNSTDVGGSYDKMFISKNYNLVTNIGRVVHDLRNLGFSSLTEDAYASAIFFLLKVNDFTHFSLLFSFQHLTLPPRHSKCWI